MKHSKHKNTQSDWDDFLPAWEWQELETWDLELPEWEEPETWDIE
jgi:hypothetical protein